MLAFGWLSDRTGWRASLVIVQEATLVVGAIILSIWPASFGLKMFAYFTLWLSNAAGPILVAWMADLTPCPSQRAIIIGVCCTAVYAVDSFANSASKPNPCALIRSCDRR
jgi:ACS family pantothenate transporter-like MFS transporter